MTRCGSLTLTSANAEIGGNPDKGDPGAQHAVAVGARQAQFDAAWSGPVNRGPGGDAVKLGGKPVEGGEGGGAGFAFDDGGQHAGLEDGAEAFAGLALFDEGDGDEAVPVAGDLLLESGVDGPAVSEQALEGVWEMAAVGPAGDVGVKVGAQGGVEAVEPFLLCLFGPDEEQVGVVEGCREGVGDILEVTLDGGVEEVERVGIAGGGELGGGGGDLEAELGLADEFEGGDEVGFAGSAFEVVVELGAGGAEGLEEGDAFGPGGNDDAIGGVAEEAADEGGEEFGGAFAETGVDQLTRQLRDGIENGWDHRVHDAGEFSLTKSLD